MIGETQTTFQTLEATLAELEKSAPDAPMLALGQTVFWDETMKAGVALALQKSGSPRRFIAGVHDTDYFAKRPTGPKEAGKFAVVPHNDTTTKGLWSAAGEFSSLFGSETVVSKETLSASGLRASAVSKSRPDFLDEATEAFGWRGVVSLDDEPLVTADIKLGELRSELKQAFDWAVENTLSAISEPDRIVSNDRAKELRAIFNSGKDSDSLSCYYRKILPALYEFTSGECAPIETSATTELLRFNLETCHKPRFKLVGLFLDPETSKLAREGYDEAIRASEIYGLERFGVGAIPFDLVVPGHGRGTIRIGNRGLVVMTPKPLFASLKRPITSLAELAEVIERRFGTNCALIGKAVTLIGMLAREFVFVFHEGASNYVRYSRRFHGLLQDAGCDIQAHPILRVRYKTWGSLSACSTFFSLPVPLHRAFGAEEICAPSFAARWSQVADEQRDLLVELSKLRGPTDLIRFLDQTVGGFWNCLNQDYAKLHKRLEKLDADLNELKVERQACYRKRRALRADRARAEIEKGQHFREKIFEKSPSSDDQRERERLTQRVEEAKHMVIANENEIRRLLDLQSDLVRDPEVVAIHERRRAIELEAELKRLRLIRYAVIASSGLEKADQRPAGWWFPLVSPDGRWFDETVKTAESYLEPLLP